MYAVLAEKLKRDEQAAHTETELTDVENLQNMLVQVELVVDLLFMTDLSHLLMFCSKEFQRFNVLPFYAITVYKDLRRQLISARDSLNRSQAPQPVPLPETDYSKPYTVWNSFANYIRSVTESQCFQNIKLLLPSEIGRVTRSGTAFGCDKDGFQAIIMQRFKAYRMYLDLLITEFKNRFEPWPEWVELCHRSLYFKNDLEFAQPK